MSELGSDNGSSYPSSLDTNNTPEVDSPAAGKTLVRAAVPNDLAAAIIAIQTELGITPSGSQTNLVTWLTQEHTTAGAHSTSSVVTSGDTQLITSNKVFTKLNFEATDTGSANAYAFGLNGSLSAYTDGLEVRGRVANTNTGTSTLSANGLSAEIIHNPDGTALVGQELKAGGIYVWIYNSTTSKWILQNEVFKSKVSSNDTTPGFLNGKLVAGENMDLTENSDGANETLTITPRTMKLFSSSGTFIKPNGVGVVRVIVIGAGGGGGGGNNIDGGGGGGGGSYAEAVVSISGNVTVTINAAGVGGANGNNPGTAGGTSVFAGDVTITANGGSGGAGGTIGTGGAGGIVGTIVAGDTIRKEGVAGAASSTSGGDGGANGGNNPGTAGALGGATDVDGADAVRFGDGGGGGGTDVAGTPAGGNGIVGIVIVMY